MKEFLIQKYEGYIKELEQSLPALSFDDADEAVIPIYAKLEAYREILTDLKML